LAYQELNHRDVLTRFGDACMQAMSFMQPVSTTCSATTTKIKLGVVSEFFQSHSVWEALIKGWVDGLDPNVIELHLFDLGKAQDEQTQYAKAHAHRYTKCPPDVKACIAEIEASHLDVLIYPDLGISAMAYRLASLRLAPVQWATWGHPETTGLRTIDSFVSADALEPDDAQAHYVEPLIRLPNLGCAVSSPTMQARAPDWAAHGLDLTRPMLVCGGTPFKYSAAFDELLVNVAKQNPSCIIVLFDYTANLHYS
jgi:protein O-GlcNAc transferase